MSPSGPGQANGINGYMKGGIQGSGATLNNPNTKRGHNNTVTIKTGLEVRQMTEHTTPT